MFVSYGLGLLAQNSLITPDQFSELLKDSNVQKLDVRSGIEFDIIGHIPNFIQINVMNKKFETRVLDSFETSKPIMVYCFSGHRSVDAVKMLNSLGFQRIYELKGGLINWIMKGYKIE